MGYFNILKEILAYQSRDAVTTVSSKLSLIMATRCWVSSGISSEISEGGRRVYAIEDGYTRMHVAEPVTPGRGIGGGISLIQDIPLFLVED
jgi:hypothetical protein